MASLQRVAFITGGSRGIGAGIVRRLAGDGVRVAFTYVQAKQQAQDLADEVGALPIRADSGDPDAVRSAVEQTVREFGRLDILVNNSSIGEVYPLAEFPLDRFERMIDVNIRGAWVAIQAAEPHLGEGGRIINMGSIFAERQPPETTPGLAGYNLTKAALDAMARGLARELAPRGITVNTILPGAINTDALSEWPATPRSAASASRPTSPTWSPTWPARKRGSSPGPVGRSTAGSLPRAGSRRHIHRPPAPRRQSLLTRT
jgi:3-oxoacyl-[acyl-carrier protein] reductase